MRPRSCHIKEAKAEAVIFGLEAGPFRGLNITATDFRPVWDG